MTGGRAGAIRVKEEAVTCGPGEKACCRKPEESSTENPDAGSRRTLKVAGTLAEASAVEAKTTKKERVEPATTPASARPGPATVKVESPAESTEIAAIGT